MGGWWWVVVVKRHFRVPLWFKPWTKTWSCHQAEQFLMQSVVIVTSYLSAVMGTIFPSLLGSTTTQQSSHQTCTDIKLVVWYGVLFTFLICRTLSVIQTQYSSHNCKVWLIFLKISFDFENFLREKLMSLLGKSQHSPLLTKAYYWAPCVKASHEVCYLEGVEDLNTISTH